MERVTRFTRLKRVPDKTAGASSQALKEVLSTVPSSLRKSVTYDNGSENAEHLSVREALGVESYFCEPYHSWEKGTVREHQWTHPALYTQENRFIDYFRISAPKRSKTGSMTDPGSVWDSKHRQKLSMQVVH